MDKPKVTTANRGPVLTETKFKNYDLCINPYVGCQFGCKYCYVRFFVKDKEKPWGEFVRLREHIADKLPKELPKAAGKRVVIGTMTDPYQPIEREHRLTRKVLELIDQAENKPSKIGVFTRSPIVVEDIDLLKKMPRIRVHLTVTPYEREVLSKLEPIAISPQRRWDTVKALKDAGIRVHVNVSPVLPIWSESFTEDFAAKMKEMEVDEFYVDPMQCYGEAMVATEAAVGHLKEWADIKTIITDKKKYKEWKETYRKSWFAAWEKYKDCKTLAIWQDHMNHIWTNMSTNAPMDPELYGDDLDVAH